MFAAGGYDSVYSIFNAMKKAEVSDVSISASDLCEKLKVVFQGDFEYVGITGKMTWNDKGEPVKGFEIVNPKK